MKLSENKRREIRNLHAFLAQRHPLAFPEANKNRPVPLKVGIRKDIAEAYPGIPPAILGAFLRTYTHRVSYLKACSEPGVGRIGLDGNPSGSVSEEEAARAREIGERVAEARRKRAAIQASTSPDSSS